MKTRGVLGCLLLIGVLVQIPRFLGRLPSLAEVSPDQLLLFHAWTLQLAVFSFLGIYFLFGKRSVAPQSERPQEPKPFALRAGRWSMGAVLFVIGLGCLGLLVPNRGGRLAALATVGQATGLISPSTGNSTL